MFDLDKVYDRRDTGDSKWDLKKKGLSPDAVSMWVADMDFPVAPPIQEAIIAKAKTGFYGYHQPDTEYYQAVISWMKKQYGWEVAREEIVLTEGVVMAIKFAIQAYTRPGDGIIVQKPVYYPFDESILKNNRKLIENELILQDDHYECDFADFEQKIIANNVKMFIFCNPHNPVGKVWQKAEIKRLGDICRKHGVIVVADEIHADFIYEGKHWPFTKVDESFKAFTIVCTAPSKSFNLAGLMTSNIIIADKRLRTVFQRVMVENGVFMLNTFSYLACQTAYTKGLPWLEEVLAYIKDNFTYLDNYLKERLPILKLIKAQGTYLAWVDFRSLGLDDKELEKFMLEEAELWLDEGYIFGTGGSGFERFNLATPRSNLKKALIKLETALKKRNLI